MIASIYIFVLINDHLNNMYVRVKLTVVLLTLLLAFLAACFRNRPHDGRGPKVTCGLSRSVGSRLPEDGALDLHV